MKVKDYLQYLIELTTKYPEVLKMKCAYSIDDEGNEYKIIYSAPTITQFHNLKGDLELVGFFDESQKHDKNSEDRDIVIKDCNALLLN